MNEREKILKIKRAIVVGQSVTFKGTEYKPIKLIWSYNKGEEIYSVQLVDPTAKSSTLDVSIQELFKEAEK